MDYISIDFQTANSNRDSVCKIAVSIVESDKIKETKAWLVKPRSSFFDAFNVSLHGITFNDVEKYPEFDVVWQEVEPIIENKLVIAHVAGYHMSVLRHVCDLYDVKYPSLQYVCSSIMAKHHWQNIPGYDLQTLCAFNDINFIPYNAESICEATALISNRMFSEKGIKSTEEITSNLQTTVGVFYEDGYIPSVSKRIRHKFDPTTYSIDPKNFNPESIFYGRNVVFTGTLSSMIREEAQKLIMNIGGNAQKGVNKETDYLVVGQQDYRIVGSDGMSAKQEKVLGMIAKGAAIEIMSEAEFIKNL